MNGFIRHAAVAGALALGLSVGATDGLAQSNSNATSKDLNVEAAPPPHWQAPPHWRPARPPHWQAPPPHWRPVQAPVARPVQASLMTVGPSVLSIGEPLGFRMASLACEGYGQLYVLSASGRSQLWLENVRLHTGQPIYYPSPGFIVRASPPAGDETVLFVVTRAPFHGFVGGTSATPFDLQYTHDGLRAAISGKARCDAPFGLGRRRGIRQGPGVIPEAATKSNVQMSSQETKMRISKYLVTASLLVLSAAVASARGDSVARSHGRAGSARRDRSAPSRAAANDDRRRSPRRHLRRRRIRPSDGRQQ